MTKRSLTRWGTVVVLACSALAAQENAGKGLPALVDGSERFGRSLLQKKHSESPEKNIVLAPLSLTVVFAAIRTHSWSRQTTGEIDQAFGWSGGLRLGSPMRMMLSIFERPAKPAPCRESPLTKRLGVQAPCRQETPEAEWVTNTFLYRDAPGGKNPVDEYFQESAKANFAFIFVNTGNHAPDAEALRKARGPVGALPKVAADPVLGPNDIWISSGMHVQTAWSGNTFSISEPHSGTFHAPAGERQVTLLDSEMAEYLYAKTSTFEAAALPGYLAYMIAVLPAPGVEITQLEQELAAKPAELDALMQRQIGVVTMPVFDIDYESHLSPIIQALGIREPFRGLEGITTIKNSRLTDVAQKIDIHVDKQGIRANAETVAGIVLGGLMAGQQPFHVVLDRPFLFLIRDQTTNALLFIGVLMDPGEGAPGSAKK